MNDGRGSTLSSAPLGGQAIAWLSNRPPGRSNANNAWQYPSNWPAPTCSDIPTEAIASYGPSPTSR